MSRLLLQFSAENHLSVSTKQSLSLVASKLKDAVDGLIRIAAIPDMQVLPAVVIYGANASGKSNLLSALNFMIGMVRNSHADGKPGEPIPRTPFALDEKTRSAPSVYEIDFIVDDVRYNYGFKITDEEVLSEWLFSFPNNRQQELFERNRSKFKFGRTLKGRNIIISDLTRKNSLFLSAAAQNSHEMLSKISLFMQSIHGDQRIAVSAFDFRSATRDVENQRIVSFLKEIGTGVTSVRQKEEAFTEEQVEFQKEFATAFTSIMHKFLKVDIPADAAETMPNKITSVELGHQSSEGKTVYFALDRESAGTRRLLSLLVPMFQALDQGTVLIVDELTASLHTKAGEMVLAMFCNPATNPNGAQLIATTHDTNLLRTKFLRRDQIWFTEKDDEGSTHVYPLTDIRTRKEDNIEVGYLQGRFGAMPFTDDAFDLLNS